MPKGHGITPTHISDDHYCAIGQVAANWAALEAMINSAIWQIGEIPDDIGACLTSQIFTYDAKLKALIALLGARGGFDSVIHKLNKFHGDSSSIAQSRNRVVHDPWVGDRETGVPHRLEITANKQLVSGYKSVPTDKLTTLAREIWELIDCFETIVKPAIERFPPLPLRET